MSAAQFLTLSAAPTSGTTFTVALPAGGLAALFPGATGTPTGMYVGYGSSTISSVTVSGNTATITITGGTIPTTLAAGAKIPFSATKLTLPPPPPLSGTPLSFPVDSTIVVNQYGNMVKYGLVTQVCVNFDAKLMSLSPSSVNIGVTVGSGSSAALQAGGTIKVDSVVDAFTGNAQDGTTSTTWKAFSTKYGGTPPTAAGQLMVITFNQQVPALKTGTVKGSEIAGKFGALGLSYDTKPVVMTPAGPPTPVQQWTGYAASGGGRRRMKRGNMKSMRNMMKMRGTKRRRGASRRR